MRNDAPEAAELDLDAFDSVVISPGPGHPANIRDFGFATRVLTDAAIPVLGVCLGHQGVGVLEGADVGPAPVARHGHLSRIRHDGRDLFQGLPQGFTAVRYHSLCVREPLPPALEATAWSDDGVLMGIRHRDRPLWGVQFHPESVLTDYGHRLLANFRDLARRHRPSGRRIVTVAAGARTALPAAEPEPAGEVGWPATLRWRVVTACISGSSKRRSIRSARSPSVRRARHVFWLDSSRVAPGQARFSYLGDGTGPLAEFIRYDASSGMMQVERPGQPLRLIAGSVFDHLQRELAHRRLGDPTLPFDFTCGYVGYLGYEMKADCGSPSRHRAATPDAGWLFADRLIVVDHQEGTTYLLCMAEDTPAGAEGAVTWLDQTAAFLPTAGSAERSPATPGAVTGNTAGNTAAGTAAHAKAVEPWLVRDRARYLADIAACQRELTAGESYEICVTNAAWLPAPGDPLGYHRLLRRHNPAPYAAFLKFGDFAVASSTPERFLKITEDGCVETKPIKGTAPRGDRPADDARLRASLAADPKTRAENLMIVDLLRNDLGQVCEVGTVHVPKLMATETYATVHQLVSTVRGKLRAGVDAVDCVRACFPGGSMTGAPKLRTLDIIDTLETEARGIYSGTIGFLSCNGTADLSVVIRTAVFVDGWLHLGAGGAIVLDSDPAAEYDEMLLKMAAPMRAYREWVAPYSGRAAPRRPVASRRRAAGRIGESALPRREAS